VPAGLKTVFRGAWKKSRSAGTAAGEVRAALEAIDLSPDEGLCRRSLSRPALIVLSLIALAAVGTLVIRNGKPSPDAKFLDPMPARVVLGVLPPAKNGDPAQSASILASWKLSTRVSASSVRVILCPSFP